MDRFHLGRILSLSKILSNVQASSTVFTDTAPFLRRTLQIIGYKLIDIIELLEIYNPNVDCREIIKRCNRNYHVLGERYLPLLTDKTYERYGDMDENKITSFYMESLFHEMLLVKKSLSKIVDKCEDTLSIIIDIPFSKPGFSNILPTKLVERVLRYSKQLTLSVNLDPTIRTRTFLHSEQLLISVFQMWDIQPSLILDFLRLEEENYTLTLIKAAFLPHPTNEQYDSDEESSEYKCSTSTNSRSTSHHRRYISSESDEGDDDDLSSNDSECCRDSDWKLVTMLLQPFGWTIPEVVEQFLTINVTENFSKGAYINALFDEMERYFHLLHAKIEQIKSLTFHNT